MFIWRENDVQPSQPKGSLEFVIKIPITVLCARKKEY